MAGMKPQPRQDELMKAALRTTGLALAAVLSGSGVAQSQNVQKRYPAMAPISQYRIASRSDEMSLARTAAPPSISARA